MTRRSGADDVLQVRQRQSCIDDVFDDDDVAPLDAAVEVLEDLHLPGRLGARSVARDRHEVERRRAGKLPREIREEDERALQDADQMDAVRMIAMNLLRDGA